MSKVPEDLKYTKSHEWFRIDGDILTMGITDYAQHQLTDIVYVDFPRVGENKNAGDNLLTVESVKSAEDVYSPATGEVVEVNSTLDATPENINRDSYEFWMVKMKVADPSSVAGMSAGEYRKFIGEA